MHKMMFGKFVPVLSFALAVIVALGMFGSVAMAAPGGKVTGGIKAVAGSTEIQVNFNAHDHKNGVKGQAKYENLEAGTWFKAEVNQCYAQNGNQAAFVGVITEADGYPVGDSFKFSVQDNGNGGSGDPDRIRVQVGSDLDCEEIGPTFPGERIEGNLTVH